MSRLSQRQAAAQWGVARITLQRAIKAGRISKDYEGKVDVADLIRVFGEPAGTASSHGHGPEKTTHEPPQRSAEARVAELEAEARMLRQMIQRADAERDRALADRDRAVADRERVETRLLTYEGAAAPKKKRWWQRGRE